MFAVLLAATTPGDPNANPVLHERLMGRMVAAVEAAADRHPRLAATMRTQVRFIRLDAEIRQVGAISQEEESAFLLNLIQSYQQLIAVANELSDPVLDLELLATQPSIIWAMTTRQRWASIRSGNSLQGLAMWYSYMRGARPAVGRVVGYTASLASQRF